ncbi:MAG: dipicolinate synthase subunit B [Firmicutes bacterium]|nr:dipicolinate synthase subunit B [Bacillota bacterium]
MSLKDLHIGFGLTGSHCTVEQVLPVMKEIASRGAFIYPIITPSFDQGETRFGSASDWKKRIVAISGRPILKTIFDVEPLGPGNILDVLVIAPCTGNTLAKLSRGITDTSVLMAAKAQFRNRKPVVVAISTNDGLGINAISLGYLLNYKNIYLVPFMQDEPYNKPNSLVARMDLLVPTVISALQGKQIQPLLFTPNQ